MQRISSRQYTTYVSFPFILLMLVVYSTKLVTLPVVETLPLPAVDPTIPEPEVVTTGLAVVPTIGGLLVFG